MGTRGAVGFKLDQKEVIFYNHYDSYPEVLGQETVDYVHSVDNWDEIRDMVNGFVQVNEGDKPTAEQKAWAYKLGTVNLSVSDRSDNDWYCLAREAQGNIALQLELGFGTLANDFVRDSLFCEFAYIINLDTMELEFYEGFNKDRNAEGRYAKGDPITGRDIQDSYGGVRLVGEAPLNDIPEDWMERFYSFEDEDDDE